MGRKNFRKKYLIIFLFLSVSFLIHSITFNQTAKNLKEKEVEISLIADVTGSFAINIFLSTHALDPGFSSSTKSFLNLPSTIPFSTKALFRIGLTDILEYQFQSKMHFVFKMDSELLKYFINDISTYWDILQNEFEVNNFLKVNVYKGRNTGIALLPMFGLFGSLLGRHNDPLNNFGNTIGLGFIIDRNIKRKNLIFYYGLLIGMKNVHLYDNDIDNFLNSASYIYYPMLQIDMSFGLERPEKLFFKRVELFFGYIFIVIEETKEEIVQHKYSKFYVSTSISTTTNLIIRNVFIFGFSGTISRPLKVRKRI